jgi:hypothetical protein
LASRRCSSPPPPLPASAPIGGPSGAIVLTKASAYLLLPGIVLALVLAARREPDAPRRLAVRGAITVGIAFIVSGWWLGLTTHWYGDPVAASATRDHYADVVPFIVDDAGSARALFIDLPQSFWSQGRIAFVSLAAIAVLYALGTERWRVPTVTRFALPVIGICGIAVALNEHVIQYY